VKRRSHAKRRDLNEPAIVEVLRACGLTVVRMDALDLLIGGVIRGRSDMRLIEVKDGNRPPSARRLTEEEARFIDEWNGPAPWVVRSVDEALCLIGRKPCRDAEKYTAYRRARGMDTPISLQVCGCGGIEDPTWLDEWRAEERARVKAQKARTCVAGKGAGINGDRSGLWREMAGNARGAEKYGDGRQRKGR
jgi:hypothetical protein